MELQSPTPNETNKENHTTNVPSQITASASSLTDKLTADSENVTLGVENVLQNTKKRTVTELFGDIDDLLNENVEYNLSKKSKGKVSDLELINHILELRKLAKEKENPTTIYRKNCSTSSGDYVKQNLSYRVPKYSFISVKRSDNERVYVRFHSEEYEKEQAALLMKNSSLSGVMGERFKEVWAEATSIVSILFTRV